MGPSAPYLGSNNKKVNWPSLDFVVINLINGLEMNPLFSDQVQGAYDANIPAIAVVGIDPEIYSTDYTLGVWPKPEDDKVFKLIKPKLINPSGGKYGIQAILIDTRSTSHLGNWVAEVTLHIREQLNAWGYDRVYLLTDASDATHKWNPAENPAVMFQQEQKPVAILDIGRAMPRVFWANSVFLHWYGSEQYGGVSTAFFRAIATKEIFYQQIGWLPRQTVVETGSFSGDVFVDNSDVMKKLAEIDETCKNILALLRKK